MSKNNNTKQARRTGPKPFAVRPRRGLVVTWFTPYGRQEIGVIRDVTGHGKGVQAQICGGEYDGQHRFMGAGEVFAMLHPAE